MNLGNIDSFAKEACICLRKTISPFLNLFQRQELGCPKIFYVSYDRNLRHKRVKDVPESLSVALNIRKVHKHPRAFSRLTLS